MAVGLLNRANATFARPLRSIQHSHQRADMCLMRVQEVRPLVVRCLGPDPTSGPQRFSFSNSIYVARSYTFLCTLWHYVSSDTNTTFSPSSWCPAARMAAPFFCTAD